MTLRDDLGADVPLAGTPARVVSLVPSLTEAISLYLRSGYVEIPAYNDEYYAHHWFEKRL